MALPRAPRWAWRTAIGVVLLAVLGYGGWWAAGNKIASDAERSLAAAVRAGDPTLLTDPFVDVSAAPFTRIRNGRYETVTILARDYQLRPVPGDRTELYYADVTGVLHGTETDGAAVTADSALRVTGVEARTRLSSQVVGRYLGLADLTIATPPEPGVAGGGGPQQPAAKRSTGLLLTASIPIPRSKDLRITVTADVALAGHDIVITPTGLYTGDQPHEKLPAWVDARSVLPHFTGRVPGTPLAFAVTPTAVYSDNSGLTVEGRTDTGLVRPADFRPTPRVDAARGDR